MKLDATPSDPVALRALFAAVPQSVVALCGLDPSGTPRGVTASSFTPISLQPPLVSVAMAHTSTTWPILRPDVATGRQSAVALPERRV